MSILDFIFPRRCVNCRKIGSYICTNCFAFIKFHEGGVCIICQKAAIGGITHPVCKTRYTPDGIFSSLVYKGVVKKLVYKFKYNPNLTDLEIVLVDLFYEGVIQKEVLYKLLQRESVLVPIPIYKARLRKRGYNQSEILAKGLSKKLDMPVLNILERVRDTKTQVGLKKEEREQNIKGAFTIKKNYESGIRKYGQVFLVDDVVTSGATLKEAAKTLKKAGVVKVYGMTLAHGL